mgnify:CR=1 FL=1
MDDEKEIIDDDYIYKYLELAAKKSEQTKQLGVLGHKVKIMKSEIEKHFKIGDSTTDRYDVIIKESHGTRIASKDKAREIIIAALGDEEGNRLYHQLTVDTCRILTAITNRLN